MIDVSNELPQIPPSWGWIKLRDIIEKVPLTGRKLQCREYQQSGSLPVIDQGQSFIGGYTDKIELEAPCLPPIIVFGDHTKVVKYIDFRFVAGADGVKVIKPLEVFSPKLFYYFLQILPLPEKGYARHFQFLEKSFLPLPPLSEQHRIVAKIEKLFTRLDAGVEGLKKVKTQLKGYCQAVLKYAFEGKLTEEWREAHKGEMEPASVLLERIKEERGKKGKGKLKELSPIDTSDLLELPVGWVWAITSDICSSVRDGTHDTPKYFKEGVPLITSKNLKENGLDFTTAKNISLEDHEKISIRSGVENGDVLFAMIGTVGNPVVVQTDRIFSIKNVALFKKKESFLSSAYLKYWLGSLTFNKILEEKRLLKGTTQKFIPLEHLRNLPVPVSPFHEQQRIVEEIENYFSVADKIEEVMGQSLMQAERLRQSILKRAFEGKLVAQDPNDEPAEKLLERIKTEKARRS